MTPKIGRKKAKKSPENRQGERTDLPVQQDSRLRPSNGSVDYQEVDEFDGEDVSPAKREEVVVDMTRGIRISIAVMFERLHGGVFKRGVAEDIRKCLGLGKHYGVQSVIKHYCIHRALGQKYTGDRIVEDTLGRKPILDVDGVEAQILADNLEDGVSIGTCWNIINDHRRQGGQDSVTYAAVYGLLQ